MIATHGIFTKIVRTAFLLAVFSFTLSPAAALANVAHYSGKTSQIMPTLDPVVALKRTWIDYNATENGQKGMRIHVELEISGLKGVRVKVVARVTKGDDDYLKSLSAYSNDEGELETSASMNPGFETTAYDDVEMFLPYSELKSAKGSRELKLDIDLKYDDGDLIQHLIFKPFVLTATGAADAVEKPEITAEVNEIWVDYNVTEGRRKGMRLHVNFEVTGLKNVDSKLTARVRKEDDEFLMSSTSFSNENGELEISYAMKPGYATSVYKDATMFLPYDEMVLRKGNWSLRFDIDLNHENGELIQHLDYHEFEFTR